MLTPARRPSRRPRPCVLVSTRVADHPTSFVSHLAGKSLDIPHVRRGLDGRHEFEGNVDQADEGGDRRGDVVVPLAAEEDAADEEVDWMGRCCQLAMFLALCLDLIAFSPTLIALFLLLFLSLSCVCDSSAAIFQGAWGRKTYTRRDR